jgi:hypothetical protein
MRSITYATNPRGAHPFILDPLGKPVVLDSPLSLDDKSYEFHHRKNRVKRVAFTVLWIVVAALILVLMFIGWRPATFEGAALFLR